MARTTPLDVARAVMALDPTDLADPAAAAPFAALSDAELTDTVARVISRPKAEPADSFILHAPLELLARSALLTLVEPGDRELARRRILWLGATYAAAGAAAADTTTPGDRPGRTSDTVVRSPGAVLTDLAAAIDRGDLDGAEVAAAALADILPPSDLGAALTDVVLPRLSAAAHGNIFLYQLPRIAPRSRVAGDMARGLVRELARQPDWNLTWHLDRPSRDGSPTTSDPWTTSSQAGPAGDPATTTGPADLADPGTDLVDALLRPRSPGPLDSNFIFPTMALVEQSGLAAELLDGPTRTIGLQSARRSLLRVAAWSMLQDDPDQAPYGWSHCLTMPQAALGIASDARDPADAVAVAATYVLGFRATQGSVALDPHWSPEPLTHLDPATRLDALAGSPDEAAAAAWHAPEPTVPAIVARLAGHAAAHPDAHLAKYTVACLDAASADPEAAHVYRAAAAFLGAWWRRLPSDDPLLP